MFTSMQRQRKIQSNMRIINPDYMKISGWWIRVEELNGFYLLFLLPSALERCAPVNCNFSLLLFENGTKKKNVCFDR